jgi:hypothetical protein
MLWSKNILYPLAQEKAEQLAVQAKQAAAKKLAEARGEEWKEPVDNNEVIRPETDEEKKYEVATQMKATW